MRHAARVRRHTVKCSSGRIYGGEGPLFSIDFVCRYRTRGAAIILVVGAHRLLRERGGETKWLQRCWTR